MSRGFELCLVYTGKFAVSTALLGDRHACYGVLAPQLFFNYSNLSILFCVMICRVSAKESTDGFIGISSSVIH